MKDVTMINTIVYHKDTILLDQEMTQRTKENRFYSKGRKTKYITNKTDVCPFDDTWRSDITHLRDCAPENNRGYRQILVEIDILQVSWTITLKNKPVQNITNSFENISKSSERQPN